MMGTILLPLEIQLIITMSCQCHDDLFHVLGEALLSVAALLKLASFSYRCSDLTAAQLVQGYYASSVTCNIFPHIVCFVHGSFICHWKQTRNQFLMETKSRSFSQSFRLKLSTLVLILLITAVVVSIWGSCTSIWAQVCDLVIFHI